MDAKLFLSLFLRVRVDTIIFISREKLNNYKKETLQDKIFDFFSSVPPTLSTSLPKS